MKLLEEACGIAGSLIKRITYPCCLCFLYNVGSAFVSILFISERIDLKMCSSSDLNRMLFKNPI